MVEAWQHFYGRLNWDQLQAELQKAERDGKTRFMPNIAKAIVALKRKTPDPATKSAMHKVVRKIWEEIMPRTNLRLATDMVAQREESLKRIEEIIVDPRKAGRQMSHVVLGDIRRLARFVLDIGVELQPRHFDLARAVLQLRITAIVTRAQEILSQEDLLDQIVVALDKAREAERRELAKRQREADERRQVWLAQIRCEQEARTEKEQQQFVARMEHNRQLNSSKDENRRLFGKNGIRNYDAKPAKAKPA